MPRLIPTDEKFFDLFELQADRATRAARLLHELFRDPTRLEERAKAIKDVEHEADAATREVVQRLNRTFVTPFDGEDILLLAKGLDDVVDRIDSTARRAAEFRIGAVRDEAGRLAELLQQATEELFKAVGGMKDPHTLDEHNRRVKELEEAGDAEYHAGVARLFSGVSDPLEVMKWKELLDLLEDALDRCNDVADTLSVISLKHS